MPDGSLTSWAAWRHWRDKVIARYRTQGSDCPLHTALSQSGGATDATRTVAADLLGRWQRQLAAGIRHMQDSREIAPALDAEQEAAALLAGIQGGVLSLMTTGSITHLEAAINLGIAHLRASGHQGR